MNPTGALYEEVVRGLLDSGICDDQTAEALLIDDAFIRDQVQKTSKAISDVSKQPQNIHANLEVKTNAEYRLFFLGSLVEETDDIRRQVVEWLGDEKRLALFEQSDQVDVYGELLVAKAKRELDAYRQDHNPDASQQVPFAFGRTLEVNAVAKRIEFAPKIDLLEMKFKAVAKTIEEKRYTYLRKYLSEFQQYVSRARAEMEDSIENRVDEITALEEFEQDVYDSHDYKALVDEFSRFLDPNEVKRALDFEKIETEEIEKKFNYLMDLIHKKDFLPKLEKIREDTFSPTVFALENLESNIGMDIGKHEMNELFELNRQSFGIVNKSSEHLKRAKAIRYTVELSDKDPLDVRYGNDSGCCIGVYNEGGIGNAFGLPTMIADNATYFFNIFQQIGNGKRRRVGIVLAFDAIDQETGAKVLACNSTELSPKNNPGYAIGQLVDFVEEAIANFAERNSYEAAVMSVHDYNTSTNFSSKKADIVEISLLRKPRRPVERGIYSEILDEDGYVEGKKGFYTLYRRHRQEIDETIEMAKKDEQDE